MSETRYYLLKEYDQIRKTWKEMGFWDDSKHNWIRKLYYGNKWGSDYENHDWLYSMRMQAETLLSAMISKNEEVDNHLHKEFNYMHHKIGEDGTVDNLHPSAFEKTYGLILRSLAIGCRYFYGKNGNLASQIYEDMNKVYEKLKKDISLPSTREGSSSILNGYTQVYKAHVLYGNVDAKEDVKRKIKKYADYFLKNQNKDGTWRHTEDARYTVQRQLKRDIAMEFAYEILRDETYLFSVKKNIDWILRHRWNNINGGVKWHSKDLYSRFECHQAWFMITCQLLYDLNTSYDYRDQITKAWKYLIENNEANIDVYYHNYEHNNAFFAYRNWATDGSYFIDKWKGSYEIGTSLWMLAFVKV